MAIPIGGTGHAVAPPAAPKVSAPAKSIALANRITAPIAVAKQNAKPVNLTPSNARAQTRNLALANRITAPVETARQAAKVKLPPSQVARSRALAELAAIQNPTSGLGKIGLNLASDIADLPKSTLEGVTQLGGAAVDDITHGRFGTTNLGNALGTGRPTELESTVSRAAASDPLFNLATGHIGRAASLASQHPLSAILDATGSAGVLGRGIGSVARTGALGGRLNDAAALARSDLEAAPGIGGTTVRRTASPNIFVSSIQHALDRNPEARASLDRFTGKSSFNRLGITGPARTLKKQTAMLYGPEKARLSREVQDTAKSLKAAKPSGKVERNAVPYIAAFGGGRDTLEHLRDSYMDAKASGTLRPSTLKQTDQHIANIDAALAKDDAGKLDWNSIHTAADAYHQRQAGLEAQKVAHGMNESPELDRALEKQYAVVRMPGAHFMDKSVTHPDSIAAKRIAAATLREETANLAKAEKIVSERTGAYKGASRVLAEAQRKLPLHPATDAFANHLLDARQMLTDAKPHDAAYDQNLLAALRDRVDTAQKEFKLIKENPKKLGGLVTEDSTARPVTSGAFKGMQVRPLTSDEVRAHMAENGAAPSYVRMTNPERNRPGSVPLMRSDITAPSSATGKTFTGQSALVGDWLPGYRALARSQQNDVRAVGQARLEHAFINRFGLKGPEGEYFTEHNWEHAQARYEHETGIKTEPLIDRAAGNDKIVLVPEAARKGLEAQLKLENPKGVAKTALNVNRAFRNTVLPMSPKLPIMHTVENSVRGALAGATPHSYALARTVLNRMDEVNPEAAARLRDLATPGGMGGGAAKLDEEDLGRLGKQHSTAYNAVTAPGRVWQQAAHGIIAFQRAIERHAQAATLGVHMRKTLQTWGHSWAEANTSVSKLADSLAQGYRDPALAEDAGKFIHRTMGQYNNFTARQRWFISRVAPFSPWYANAARLVWHELPVGHPLKTALAQDVATANQPGWNATHSGLPADMQTFASLGPGHYLDVGRFTPIGIEKNPLEEGVPLAFPAYESAALALFGKDPFGNDMYGPNTPYGKPGVAPLSGSAALHAVDQILEGTMGPASSIARVLEGRGSTMYNDSMPIFGKAEVKPNTKHGSGLNKVFNPFAGVWYGHGGASGALPTTPTNSLKGSGVTLKGGNTTLKGGGVTLP
jgi:hypothetical protein